MADFEEDIADSAARPPQQDDDLYGDHYPSEPTQNMTDKPGFEVGADGKLSDHQDPYASHTVHAYEDENSQCNFQHQQYELQQQHQLLDDVVDEGLAHDEFTGSGGLGKGDYYDNGEEDDLPANFNRGNQEVPQTDGFEQPRSFENTGEPPVNFSGGIAYNGDQAQMLHEEQQVVPGSNAYDDERPIMGSYNNPFLSKDDSPQQQEMPQEFGADHHQQQYQDQQNSDDEEDNTIDEIHPAEAEHGYGRLEEEPQHMNDTPEDVDAEDADIEMDPVDNIQFEERQDLNDMEFSHGEPAGKPPHVFDTADNDLVSGGFNPTTLEEPIVAATSVPGVESCAATVPEEDFEPNEVEERMMSAVSGSVESGVPSQMMLDDQDDDEDKENAAPQREEELQPHRVAGMESELVEMAPTCEEVSHETDGRDEDEENVVSKTDLTGENSPIAGAAEAGGLDNPAFAEDDMGDVPDDRKLEQITEFGDAEVEKLQETHDEQAHDIKEEEEEEESDEEGRFADDVETEPVSDFQFSSQAFTSDLESTPNTPGFVDNLSELASPAEVIPQPLPSPPEPREGISPFDPLEDRDSPYDKYKESEGDEYSNEFTREEPINDGAAERGDSDVGILPATSAGGAGTDELVGFGAGDSGAVSTSLLQDSSTAGGAADFLTGEVEGETTFGVDGTAATTLTETTAPTAEIINTGGQENAGFLNSEDEEEEEEDESQLMDHGIGEAGDTTTTTTTEEASDDITGTGMEHEGATDNALMSMSMEGSFYDDGGDVIGGGDDQGRQHGGGVGGMNHLSNSMYHPDPITEESASQPSSYDQRMDGILSSQTDDQNFSQDLMQTSTDVADNILGDREVEQQHQSNADLLSEVPVTSAQEYSSQDAATFEGLEDDAKQQEDAAAAEEEAQLRQMEEQLRLEEEQMRQEEELQRQEEERQRQAEEQMKLEEEQRLREEQLRQEEERLQQEEEERLRLEEERLREEEKLRLEAEEEKRLQEEELRLLEEQRFKQEEEERRQQEAEAEERRLEAERQKQQEEAEERNRLEEEQLRQEEERQKLEEVQKRLEKEEQERAREEELARASASEAMSSVDAPVTEASADVPAPINDSSSVDAPVVEELPAAAAASDTTVEATSAAAVAAAVPALAAAAAASPEKKATSKSATKTSTASPATKKSATPTSKTAASKTATTGAPKTTTKTPSKTTTNGRPASATTKKTETTKTPPSSAPSASRKPFDNRPITALERKAAAAKPSPTTAATRPTSASKSNAPLPSYAQPITPRKPREPKVLSPEEKKKTTTGRTPSATARTPRPQSATTTNTTRTTSATTSSTTRTTSATTKSAASSGSTSPTKTPTTARPKSSPTKLSNGTSSDTKPFTARPAPKTTTTPRSAPAAAKTSTPGSAGAKSSPRPTTTPRTPATPKTTDARSKIGSLDKTAHTPGGGNVKITSKKTDYTNVTSKIGSKDKMDHKPGGGQVKIENRKLKVEAKSKIGSLDNAAHKPTGGDKKIESHKLNFKEKASPKIGSLDKARLNSEGEGEEEAISEPTTEVHTNGDGAAQAI